MLAVLLIPARQTHYLQPPLTHKVYLKHSGLFQWNGWATLMALVLGGIHSFGRSGLACTTAYFAHH